MLLWTLQVIQHNEQVCPYWGSWCCLPQACSWPWGHSPAGWQAQTFAENRVNTLLHVWDVCASTQNTHRSIKKNSLSLSLSHKHTHKQINTHACMHCLNVHTHTHTQTHTRAQTHIHAYIDAHITHTHTHKDIQAHMHKHAQRCTHARARAHTHTLFTGTNTCMFARWLWLLDCLRFSLLLLFCSLDEWEEADCRAASLDSTESHKHNNPLSVCV